MLQTTSPMYKKSTFSVLRRYSDFLWLYETLSMNNPGVVVPPVPDKNPFGRFDNEFVQQRRLALEKCIQKIAAHPVLQKDADLKLFLESDTFSLDVCSPHFRPTRLVLTAAVIADQAPQSGDCAGEGWPYECDWPDDRRSSVPRN